MPTHDEEERFWRDWATLTRNQQERFGVAVEKMVEDLQARRVFRPSLRVKGVQGHEGIYEMTWAPDGRATFTYGTSPIAGETHIIWRRIGSHDIFQDP